MENLIVAFSNLPCVYPLYIAYTNNDILTFGAIAFVSTASFVSHLIENHKHGMPGIGFSENISYIANRFDVLGCIGVISRFAYIFYKKYGFNAEIIKQNYMLVFCASLCMMCLRISEYDKYNPELRTMYISTHTIWHMGIFSVMGKFLSNVIY